MEIMYRKGETQVGIMIIFVITILIALGFLGVIVYFYKKSVGSKFYMSILGNKYISITDLNSIGLCKTSSWAKINYSPLNDTYTLTCENQLGEDVSKFPEIVIISDCSSGSNICKYRFRK